MSRKIIGVTVGTQLPKPNFKQTDPTKGDYIKNKPDFEGLKSKVNTVSELVGATAVSEQIDTAIAEAIPVVTESDNGKFLRVVNGIWTASSIPNAEDGEF